MNVHASSYRSHTKTPNNATPTVKGPSSASGQQTQNAWVEQNSQTLLKAFSNWTRADGQEMFIRTKTVPFYKAKERSDINLKYTLGAIHKDYGPVDLRYEGCDTLARHWVSGWDAHSISGKPEETIMICVDMGERLPGQAPALDRLQREIKADSDEEENDGKKYDDTDSDEEKDNGKDRDSVDSEDEKNIEIADLDLTEQQIADFDREMNEDGDHERADWVDVDDGGVEDSKWIKSNNRATMVKDAARMLLEGFRKL